MIPATENATVPWLLALVTGVWNFAWDHMTEVHPGLWVGNIAAAYDAERLGRAGITHVVAATQFGSAAVFHKGQFEYLVVKVQDVDDADIQSALDEAADFIRDAVAEGRSVLVHCNQGRSRSATIAAAYLVKHCGMTPVGALEAMRKKREVICPNPGFIRQLADFAEQ